METKLKEKFFCYCFSFEDKMWEEPNSWHTGLLD